MEHHNLSEICRLCLAKDDKLVFVAKRNGPSRFQSNRLGKLVEDLIEIKINTLPIFNKICFNCENILNGFNDFKARAIKIHSKLLEIELSRRTSSSNSSKLNPPQVNAATPPNDCIAIPSSSQEMVNEITSANRDKNECLNTIGEDKTFEIENNDDDLHRMLLNNESNVYNNMFPSMHSPTFSYHEAEWQIDERINEQNTISITDIDITDPSTEPRKDLDSNSDSSDDSSDESAENGNNSSDSISENSDRCARNSTMKEHRDREETESSINGCDIEATDAAPLDSDNSHKKNGRRNDRKCKRSYSNRDQPSNDYEYKCYCQPCEEKFASSLLLYNHMYQHVADDTHYLHKFIGNNSKQSRKRCSECYKTIRQRCGAVVASKKARQVLTKCNECDKPFCLDCFVDFHYKLRRE